MQIGRLRAGFSVLADGTQPCVAAAHKLLVWLIPSPFSRSPAVKTPAPSSSSSSAADKITALDGLRGIACLIVLHEHWSCAIDDPWRPYIIPELAKGIMWKPFFILLWDGQAMVNLFFVISGYVLTYKPLGMLYTAQHQKMYEVVASSVFRRAFRLFLPTMTALLLIAVLAQLRAFDPARRVFQDLNAAEVKAFQAANEVPEYADFQPWLMREPPVFVADSFLNQIKEALSECYLLLQTSMPGVPSNDRFYYDAHVWTLPVECKGSMAIFLLAVGTSMLTSGWRLFWHISALLWCMLRDYHDISLFVGGMVVAEIDLVRKHAGHVPLSGLLGRLFDHISSRSSLRRVDVAQVAWFATFVLGLFILSIPFIEPVTLFPYDIVAHLLPESIGQKNRAIRSVGAILTTWSCVNSGVMAAVLQSSIPQYLGKISFALYLTHGLMIRSLGYVVIGGLRGYLGAFVRQETSLQQLVVIWLCGYVVMMPFFLWVADLFSRAIDAPFTRLTRWIEMRSKRPQRHKSMEDVIIGVV